MTYRRKTYYNRGTRPQMTAEEARTFERYSEANVQLIGAAIRTRAEAGTHADCTCKAYQDIFTYDRWQALGFQVKRGETKLVSVTTMREKKDDAGNVIGKYPWYSALFCRCQVKAKSTTTAQLVNPIVEGNSPMIDGGPEDIAIKHLEQIAEQEQEEAAFLSDPDFRLGGKFSSLEL